LANRRLTKSLSKMGEFVIV